MPIPLTVLDVTDINHTAGTSGNWRIEVYSIVGDVLLATYDEDIDYVDQVENEQLEPVYIKFTNHLGVIDIADNDRIDIVADGITTTIFGLSTFVYDVNYYVDNKGILYSDLELTTMVHLGSVEDETVINVESAENIALSEGNETIKITELGEDGEVDEDEETILILENIIDIFPDADDVEEILTISEKITDRITGTGGSGFSQVTPSNPTDWVEKT
jgi:hypothetical protein